MTGDAQLGLGLFEEQLTLHHGMPDSVEASSPAVAAAIADLRADSFRTGKSIRSEQIDRTIERRALSPEDGARLYAEASRLGLLEKEEPSPSNHAAATIEYDSSSADLDTLRPYIREMGRRPLLSARDEIELARGLALGRQALETLRNGSVHDARLRIELERAAERGQAARELFITSNLRLAYSIARGYQHRGLELLDLIQEANIGLIIAVDKFDHTRGFKFSTYATWWIRQRVQRAIADQGRVIRIPVHVHELLIKVSGAERRLRERLSREPTTEELAQHARVEVEKVAAIQQLVQEPLSLDALRRESDDDGGDLFDLIAGAHVLPTAEVEQTAVAKSIAELLDGLPERKRDILRRRYGFHDDTEQTLEEVGQHYEVTRERVRQLQSQAEEQLRAQLEPMEIDAWITEF